jgi:acyl-CoA hydrolase
VTVWVALPPRQFDFAHEPSTAGHFFVEYWFYGAPDRAVHPQGWISYIPNNLHATAKVKAAAVGGHVDILWGAATPPDKRGFMSLSVGLINEKMLIEAVDRVVQERNEDLPWTLGDSQIHISDVDCVGADHVNLPCCPHCTEQVCGL